ncbi:MAG: c-type cytochrome [Acidobacteriota bacterium]|nr:c-type cytochrome [Acidobacteriota bacterium]
MRIPLLVFGFVTFTGVAVAHGAQAAAPPLAPMPPQAAHAQDQSGGALYATACASCHGINGSGAPRAQVAFTDPLPDFRDCQFAPREPDSDWLAVIHDGGPARAFGRMMPAYAGALTLEQMERVLAHVRGFCTDAAWPRGELNLPRPLLTEKAFPEDELVLSTSVATKGAGAVSNKLVYEKRLGPRNQLEVVVPFAFLQNATADAAGWGGGIGDLTLGMKRAVVHSHARGTIFSVAGEIILPIGDEALGLSKGTPIFEPFVSFGQVLPADGFIQAQAGIELPFDRERAEREAFWRVALGRSFSQRNWGRSWSPMVELVAARELASGATTHWDIAPGLQVSLSTRQHVLAAGGVRLPINDREGRHPQVLFYVLWDWFDGSLFGGW